MSSTRPMSRRRFLAVVAGTTGAAAAAGLGGWRLLEKRSGPTPSTGHLAVNPGVEIVEIQPGFADATVWNDELLTLRASPTGTGIMLRSETTGTDHPVDTPSEFAARCIGVIDGTIVIGGHRLQSLGTRSFEASSDYRNLMVQAGPESRRLAAQPRLATVEAHTHDLVIRAPSVNTSNDLVAWQDADLRPAGSRGGSCGAVLERQGLVAIDRYADGDSPDSIYEVSFHNLDESRDAKVSGRESLPIDHGAVWGTSFDGGQDIIVLHDRAGTRAYGEDNQAVFAINDGIVVSAVVPVLSGLAVDTITPQGDREIRIYRDGVMSSAQLVGTSEPRVSQVSPMIAIAANGPNLGIARAIESNLSY